MALSELEVGAIVVAVIVLLAILLLFALKIYAVLTRGVCNCDTNMTGKTVIVTGATSGIGKETAREMVRLGARVILACRNTDEAKKVKDEITQGDSSNVIIKKLDLSSMESVRAFAADVYRTENRLNVLIHNAGVAYTFEKVVSVDGLDMTMATNHFGPFLLTHLLIDLLKRSKPSRVVVVASELYRFCCCTFNVNQINPVRFWLPAYLYYYSKYINILFCLELSRRLEGTGVTVNCLHPGMIDSGIWRNVPFPLSLIMWPLIKGLFKTPAEGALTTKHCAVSPKVEGVTGKYYLDCKPFGLSDAIQDPAIAKKAWELSEPLVLNANDPRI